MPRNLLLCLLMLALWTPALPARAEPAAPPVPEEDSQAIRAVLRDLYGAYQARDLQAVMGLIQQAVDSSARDYQERHPEDPDSGQAIRDAFLAFHEDIFGHREYQLLDFQDGFVDYTARPDGTVEVSSSVPIIATESMTFTDTDGTPTVIRLRLGRFVLREEGGAWRIVEMNLF